jgi:hypothetical protein
VAVPPIVSASQLPAHRRNKWPSISTTPGFRGFPSSIPTISSSTGGQIEPRIVREEDQGVGTDHLSVYWGAGRGLAVLTHQLNHAVRIVDAQPQPRVLGGSS